MSDQGAENAENNQGADNAAEVSSSESSEQGIEQPADAHENWSVTDDCENFDENGRVRNVSINTVP